MKITSSLAPSAWPPASRRPQVPSTADQPEAQALRPSGTVRRWHRFWAQSWTMQYYRLALGVMVINGVGLYVGLKKLPELQSLAHSGWNPLIGFLGVAALVNFFTALVFRQQWMINGLFALATSAPRRWPLAIRRRLAKVYHFGGVSVGAYACGSVWVVAMAAFSWVASSRAELGLGLAMLPTIIALVLSVVCALSLPRWRHPYHNLWEVVSRFGNWLVLALFWWWHLVADVAPVGVSGAVVTSMLVGMSLMHLWPWLRLRKVAITYEKPSDHVVLVRPQGEKTAFAGSSNELSRSPLMEWHSFASIPEPGVDGFRLAVSRAGDWTGSLIEERPRYLWMRGITTAGVGRVEKLFKRVLWVATGSGIGPTLPHLLADPQRQCLIWSTRNPERTYGESLHQQVGAHVDQSIIWDTSSRGKPDLLSMAVDAVEHWQIEAVIIIANPKVTWQLVSGLESRQIPAYGAIWDS